MRLRRQLLALMLSMFGCTESAEQTTTTHNTSSFVLADQVGQSPPPSTAGFGDMMGVNIQFKHGEADLLADLDQAHADGYRYARIDHARDFVGNDFSKYDNIVARAKVYGMTLVLNIMDYTQPAPTTDAERAQWREYLQHVYYYYAINNSPVVFEFWNEQNYEPFWRGATPSGSSFGSLLDQALVGLDFSSKWVTDNRPGASKLRYASGGFVYNCWNQEPTENFMRDMLSAGSVQDSEMSAIGVHPYLWAQGFEPEARRLNHDGYIHLQQTIGDTRPYWVTEYGYSSSTFDPSGNTVLANNGTPDVQNRFDGTAYAARFRQANWNLRSSFIEWSLGTPIATIYALKDATSSNFAYSNTENEDNFGQYDQHRNIKPSGTALRFALEQTKGATLDRVFQFPDSDQGLSALKFSTAAQTTFVAWAGKRGTTATVTIPVPAGKHVAAFNLFGSFQQYWDSSDEGSISSAVIEAEGPRYFVIY
jgi:hypothetical protein